MQTTDIASLTFEADGLEVGDSGAGPEVEEVVVGGLGERLALVPVVVHVEGLALGVGLAAGRAVGHDAAVAVAEHARGAGADELVAGGLLEGEPGAGEAARAVCKHPALSYGERRRQGEERRRRVSEGVIPTCRQGSISQTPLVLYVR